MNFRKGGNVGMGRERTASVVAGRTIAWKAIVVIQ